MRIIGIDPGLNIAGWGIINKDNHKLEFIACGHIKTKASDDMNVRLSFLHAEISKIIERYSPQYCSMEQIFLNKNPLSTIKLAQARGALMSAVTADIAFYEYLPATIKKSLSCNGKSSKEQLKAMVEILLPKARISKLDESDALAIAITCAHHNL